MIFSPNSTNLQINPNNHFLQGMGGCSHFPQPGRPCSKRSMVVSTRRGTADAWYTVTASGWELSFRFGKSNVLGVGCPRSESIVAKGASRCDIRKILGFFDPLPPCPHLDLIYTIKFKQPPLLRTLFNDPPPPSDADVISGGPNPIINFPTKNSLPERIT